MQILTFKGLLEDYKNGRIDIDSAAQLYGNLQEMGFATIDMHRRERTGCPEVIYAEGKTIDQVKQIMERMHAKNMDILATRASREMYEAVKKISIDLKYNDQGRTITLKKNAPVRSELSYIAVVTAGTSDIPVAEEAVVTAEFLGNQVERIYDVGVAGIHRLFGELERIRSAKVIIVAAGMEGALASVLTGLVSKPVIGVPTSIGYGANLNGFTALLSMLNSCSSGISVVNIDNGYGAACQASLINQL